MFGGGVGVFFELEYGCVWVNFIKNDPKMVNCALFCQKNVKNGGILRICGCFEVCGAVKCRVFVVGDC